MLITLRQDNLLRAIITEHIKTALPIGSDVLVEKQHLNLSSATVRNEMLALDKNGYLEKTHTSSGRVPTEKAYLYFIENNFKPKQISDEHKKKMGLFVRNKDERDCVKNIAKTISEISHEFVLVAFSDNDFYYTGLTHLFAQPEFSDKNIICTISQVIDRLDYRLSYVFKKLRGETKTYVGSKNPFDSSMSFVATKPINAPLIGMLGPMRMDYETNIGLIEYSNSVLTYRNLKKCYT